eukprot:766293-Hanusia_phi.AAC.2
MLQKNQQEFSWISDELVCRDIAASSGLTYLLHRSKSMLRFRLISAPMAFSCNGATSSCLCMSARILSGAWEAMMSLR